MPRHDLFLRISPQMHVLSCRVHNSPICTRSPGVHQRVLFTSECCSASPLIKNYSYWSQSIPLKFISHLFSFPSGRYLKFDFPLEIESRCDKLNLPLKMMSAREKSGCNPPALLSAYLRAQLKKITFSYFQFGIHNSSALLVVLAKSRNLYINKLLVW